MKAKVMQHEKQCQVNAQPLRCHSWVHRVTGSMARGDVSVQGVGHVVAAAEQITHVSKLMQENIEDQGNKREYVSTQSSDRIESVPVIRFRGKDSHRPSVYDRIIT